MRAATSIDEIGAVRRGHPAFTGCQTLRGVETMHDSVASGGRCQSMGGIFDDRQSVLASQSPNRFHVAEITAEMNRQQRLCPRSNAGGDQGQVRYCRHRTSARTGVAPACMMARTVAQNVSGDVITSSPGPTPSAVRASCRPELHEFTATAYGAPAYSREQSLELGDSRAGRPASQTRTAERRRSPPL